MNDSHRSSLGGLGWALGFLAVFGLTLILVACGNSPVIGQPPDTGSSENTDDNTDTGAENGDDGDGADDSSDAGSGDGDSSGNTSADGADDTSAGVDGAGDTDPGDLPSEAVYFSEYGPIDLSGFSRGLESCAGIDPADYSELLATELVVNDDRHLANVEPSSPDRTCILFAAENPEVELVRIDAVNDTERFTSWIDHNPQLDAADVGIFQAADDAGTFLFGDSSDLGYATLDVTSAGAQLVVSARLWDSGIEYSPPPSTTLAAMATVAAQQLTSSGAGPATSVLESCDDLDSEKWKELVDKPLDSFVASSFNGALTCTADTSDGDRVQVLIAETEFDEDALTRTDLLRSAYETSLRTPDRLQLDGSESAWEIDRIYDDNPSQTEQSVLQEVFGNEGKIFARVSVRQDTKGQRVPIETVGRALTAVLTGTPFESEPVDDGPRFQLPPSSAAQQFIDSGARIEVAPLTRGLSECSEINLTPFETIVGKELVAVSGIVVANLNPNLQVGLGDSTSRSDDESFQNKAATPGEQIVECSLVREDDTSVVEMRVSAATKPTGPNLWANSALIEGLKAFNGVGDAAFWNEGKGNTGDNADSERAGLILYVEENDARLLVELVKYEATPDVDLFWISQAFATELFSPDE